MHTASTSANALTPSVLRLALGGDSAAAARIFEDTFPDLLNAARWRAPKLPVDLHQEIVSETWRLVYERGMPSFERAAVDDLTYLHMVLRNAAEVVAANNRPPATRSRFRRDTEVTRTSTFLEPSEVDAEANLCGERFEEHEEQMTARLEVALVLSRMSPSERSAAIFLLDNDATLTEAAESAGFTRQTLARRFAALRIAA